MSGSTLRVILTIGQLAQRLNEPLHRVEYAVRTRNITPIGIAGNARVFGEDHVEQIAAALREIDARKQGGAA